MPRVLRFSRHSRTTRSSRHDRVYRHRSKAECVNADLRNRGIQHVLPRGGDNVRAALLWFAVAQNPMRAVAPRAGPAHGRSVLSLPGNSRLCPWNSILPENCLIPSYAIFGQEGSGWMKTL
jgi:hypothetical protein